MHRIPAWTFAFVVWGVLSLPAASSAGSFKSLSKELSRAAVDAKIKSVAVLPFLPLDDSPSSEGRVIAERLTNGIARRGGVRVVERGLLPSVFDEHHIGRSGAMDKARLARVGAMLQAQAVVVGTFLYDGRKAEIHARLVELETGAVLAARTLRAKARRVPRRAVHLALPGLVPRPTGRARVPASKPAGRDGCADARTRMDSLMRGVIGLKARHWAGEIRAHGLSRKVVEARLGASFPEPTAREIFVGLLRTAVSEAPRPLDPEESRRLTRADSEAFLLRLRCRRALEPEGTPLAAR